MNTQEMLATKAGFEITESSPGRYSVRHGLLTITVEAVATNVATGLPLRNFEGRYDYSATVEPTGGNWAKSVLTGFATGCHAEWEGLDNVVSVISFLSAWKEALEHDNWGSENIDLFPCSAMWIPDHDDFGAFEMLAYIEEEENELS